LNGGVHASTANGVVWLIAPATVGSNNVYPTIHEAKGNVMNGIEVHLQ